MNKVISQHAPGVIEACELPQGSIGVVCDESTSYSGEHLMRCDGVCVSLEDGGTWPDDTPLLVRPLPPGSKISVTLI